MDMYVINIFFSIVCVSHNFIIYCMHKFCESLAKLAKKIEKIMRTKYFIKIGKLWGIIFVVIFFYKRICPFDSFTLITFWETTKIFS